MIRQRGGNFAAIANVAGLTLWSAGEQRYHQTAVLDVDGTVFFAVARVTIN